MAGPYAFARRTDGVDDVMAADVNNLQIALEWLSAFKRAEVDFGAVPTGLARFTVADADCTTSSKIDIAQDGSTPTGGFGDEAAWDPVLVLATPGNGQLTLDVVPQYGRLVLGKFRFTYTLG